VHACGAVAVGYHVYAAAITVTIDKGADSEHNEAAITAEKLD
jgi:hypothetical protein